MEFDRLQLFVLVNHLEQQLDLDKVVGKFLTDLTVLVDYAEHSWCLYKFRLTLHITHSLYHKPKVTVRS